jgi:hypothetical protein
MFHERFGEDAGAVLAEAQAAHAGTGVVRFVRHGHAGAEEVSEG